MAHDLSWILGTSITRVEYDSETLRWLFVMDNRTLLAVNCCWQIVRDGRVQLASGDHKQQYGLPAPIDAQVQATSALSGRKIQKITCDPASADLAIELEEAVLLRTFNDSSGYEAWELTGPQGRYLVAQGGGNICSWDAKP